MRYIDTLRDGDRVADVYLCKTKNTALTKTGKEYENLILQDKTGQIDGKIWEVNSGGIGDFDAGDYIDITGQVTSFNGTLQIKIDRVRRVREGEYDPKDYVPSTRFDIEVMYADILRYVKSIENTYIRKLLESFFVEDEAFISKFKSVAAGKSVHHGFMGGLIEHSLSVTRMCDAMAKNYDYLNRDILVACGMLHDCGKVKEIAPMPISDYTDEGNFIGHIVLGYEMVKEKIAKIEGFPQILADQIGHCILSHHGKLEFGSPKRPAIAEAIALSYADDCDAKLEAMYEALSAKDSNDWLGYNKWVDSNIKKTIV